MTPRRKSGDSSDTPSRLRRAPATSPEARENQLIAAAVDLAEKQILEGTASSQVLTHYLKLATTREQLEKEKIRNENELLKAKVDAIKSTERMEQLYESAIEAMRGYSVEGPTADDHD